MARVKLDLPDRFGFKTELTVRIGDVNYGQHLGNDSILLFAQEARLRFLKRHDMCEGDVGGCGLIMSDAVVEYKSQAWHGDVLRVEVAVADPRRSGFDFVYRMTHRATGREVARVKTGMVFFDYTAGRPARMPEKFRAALLPDVKTEG